jgi:hypothetical protein
MSLICSWFQVTFVTRIQFMWFGALGGDKRGFLSDEKDAIMLSSVPRKGCNNVGKIFVMAPLLGDTPFPGFDRPTPAPTSTSVSKSLGLF